MWRGLAGLRTLRTGAFPFNEPWPDWRRDPTWERVVLPTNATWEFDQGRINPCVGFTGSRHERTSPLSTRELRPPPPAEAKIQVSKVPGRLLDEMPQDPSQRNDVDPLRCVSL
jgi:hypothetical protein